VVVLCPRCGNIGYKTVKIIRGNPYIYYIHKDSKTGRISRTCYIGPAEGYKHAEDKLQLGLTNTEEVDYLEVAARALVRHALERAKLSNLDLDRAIREAVKDLEAILPSIAREELEIAEKERSLGKT